MAQVDTPADRRAEVEVDTISDTVAELKAKKLLDTVGEGLEEMQVDTTHYQRLVQVGVNTHLEILYDVEAKEIIEALVER